MSKEKAPQKQINQETLNLQYQELCSRLGDCQYRITQYKREMKALEEQIDLLNKLSAQLQSSEQK